MRKKPPRREKPPAKKLQNEGGRTFVVGYQWIARLGDRQAVDTTEAAAAQKLLKQLDKDTDNE